MSSNLNFGIYAGPGDVKLQAGLDHSVSTVDTTAESAVVRLQVNRKGLRLYLVQNYDLTREIYHLLARQKFCTGKLNPIQVCPVHILP